MATAVAVVIKMATLMGFANGISWNMSALVAAELKCWDLSIRGLADRNEGSMYAPKGVPVEQIG